MFSRMLFRIALFLSDKPKWPFVLLLAIVLILPFAGIIGAHIYQDMDNDPDRGAVAIEAGTFGENYAVPEYLDQGWSPANSLRFYTTTQGSALLPYDFLLALEQPALNNRVECERNGKTGPWFLCDRNIDRFRYLPQAATLFNPDALPVGFARETYQGKDYAGYTCAACHTGQVNFGDRALRIDGGPAMADMVGFLTELGRAMKLTQGLPDRRNPRLERFVETVLALENDYTDRAEIEADLKKWTNVVALYNSLNHPTYLADDPATGTKVHREIEYGYARLDAFGRIYNRVIEHAINHDQVVAELMQVTGADGEALLTPAQIDTVVAGTSELILHDDDFARIVERLTNLHPGNENRARREDLLLRVRDKIFNSPNAPVSYPFLWDVPSSDYVQWNGLASDAGAGPLGRNTGEVIGVFGILDWQEDTRWLTKLTGVSLSGLLSGQSNKKRHIRFKSSIDLFNLQRLENQLTSLMSPRWPFCRDAAADDRYYLPDGPADVPVDRRDCRSGDARFDMAARERGRLLYIDKCESCHTNIKRDAWDRLNVSNMTSLDKIGTDPQMALNSVNYTGKAGNFAGTYQPTDVGDVVLREEAPVVQILTAATAGAVGSPDPDKWLPQRVVDWIYTLYLSFADNRIKPSIKVGDYIPDTTAQPYNSLLSYRARSLNGIWATAPYLHNGSVPNLYELLLPPRRENEDRGCERYRSDEPFIVGAREFDPVLVGMKSDGYDGFVFDPAIPGNVNGGHDYGGCEMSHEQRMDLIEYLKSIGETEHYAEGKPTDG